MKFFQFSQFFRFLTRPSTANNVKSTHPSILAYDSADSLDRRKLQHLPRHLENYWVLLLYTMIVSSLSLIGGGKLLPGSSSYSTIAAEVVESGTFGTTYRPPAYTFILVLVRSFFSSLNEEILLALHIIFGLLIYYLIYKIAYNLSKSYICANIATFLYTINIFLHIENLSNRDTVLYIFLELLFFYVLISSSKGVESCFILGLLSGLAHLTRPNGILLLISLIVSIFFFSPLKNISRFGVFQGILAAFVGFLLIFLPWQYKIYSLTGNFGVSSSTSNGLNFWKGNNLYTYSLLPSVDIDKLDPIAKNVAKSEDFSLNRSNRLFIKKSLKFLKAEPILALKLYFKKFVLFLAPFPVPLGNGDVVFEKSGIMINHFRFRKRLVVNDY